MFKSLFTFAFFVFSANLFSLELSSFNPEIYNSLLSPEQANSRRLNFSGFDEAVKEINEIIAKQEIPMGLRLLHKHQAVRTGEAMVEIFQNYFIPTSSSAYIIAPLSIASSVDGLITLTDGSEVFPSSWIFLDGEYKVFEFTTDSKVGGLYKRLKENNRILNLVSELLEKHNLQNLLSPAILLREDTEISGSKMLIESQYVGYGSVVVPMRDSTLTAIQTSWSPEREDWCQPHYSCVWDNDSQTHYLHNDHVHTY